MRYEIVKRVRWVWGEGKEKGQAEDFYYVKIDGQHYQGAVFSDLETARNCVTDYLMRMDDEEVVEVIDGE